MATFIIYELFENHGQLAPVWFRTKYPDERLENVLNHPTFRENRYFQLLGIPEEQMSAEIVLTKIARHCTDLRERNVSFEHFILIIKEILIAIHQETHQVAEKWEQIYYKFLRGNIIKCVYEIYDNFDESFVPTWFSERYPRPSSIDTKPSTVKDQETDDAVEDDAVEDDALEDDTRVEIKIFDLVKDRHRIVMTFVGKREVSSKSTSMTMNVYRVDHTFSDSREDYQEEFLSKWTLPYNVAKNYHEIRTFLFD